MKIKIKGKVKRKIKGMIKGMIKEKKIIQNLICSTLLKLWVIEISKSLIKRKNYQCYYKNSQINMI